MRLLLVSDSPALASGQARMTRELARRFHADGHEITVAGWFDKMAPEHTEPYEIVHAEKTKPQQLGPILASCQPEAVLCLGDPPDFGWLAGQRAIGSAWTLFGYLNVETADLPLSQEVTLDAFDGLRITSQHGAAAVGRVGVSAVHLG